MTCPSCSTELPPRATFCGGCGRFVDDPFIGAVIDEHYRIEARLAVGGFGAIYRASRASGEPDVAIKVMHPELAADDHLVERFRREGRVLFELHDPHTVKTLALGDTAEGRPYIVMELLEGTTLVETFQLGGPMPWRRVLAIIRAICSALVEAHARGVVHRDLKPANIFLLRDDFVKVLDFGIAKIMHGSTLPGGPELTQLGQTVGTLEYMAPEQLMGGKADPRTDLYTLGVVAFELIGGRRPFRAAGLDLLTVQLSEAPPAVSAHQPVPPAVDQLIARCMAPDPAERHADAASLMTAIDDALGEPDVRESDTAVEAALPPEPAPPPRVLPPRP
nr:serine/threonine protein kinase [Myxococcota bacterium]